MRWRESIINMFKENVNNFIEIGPGNVLSGLNKRIDRALNSISISNCTNIDDALELISSER